MTFHLYKFQEEDVEKIVRQRAGLIGSEMGTGKTHEAVALDEAWWKKGAPPTLVVAPLNTLEPWVDKYSMQSPQTDIVVIDRKNRDAFIEALRRRQGDVYLIHWEGLRLLAGQLRKFQFNTVIADEVHRVSNRKAQVTRALKWLRTNYKLGMSGTATGDKPQNLWSVLNWLWPTYYTSYWRFFHHYVKWDWHDPDEKDYRIVTGVQNAKSLREQMDPWYVRHLKQEQCCNHHPDGVMPWLEDKVYDAIWVDLLPTQRRIYNQMRKEMIAWVNENQDTPLVVGQAVVQLTRLSQMALATPEVYTKKVVRRDGTEEFIEAVRLVEPSAKLDAVQELIKDHDEKQFVIASSSRRICYIAQEKFARAGISSFVLSGDTPQRERDGMIKRFARGDTQLFIGVIDAMGEGIDGLQYATDTMIFLDRSWKTAKNKQCEDRLHRDGQKNTVEIIDIMARSTLDFGRQTKLEQKWSWIREILGDPSGAQRSLQMRKAG